MKSRKSRIVFVVVVIVAIALVMVIDASRPTYPTWFQPQPMSVYPPPGYPDSPEYGTGGGSQGYSGSPYDECMASAYSSEDKTACTDFLAFGP